MLTADNSYLIEYKERIDCGEIVAGQDLRLELENLMEDLSNDRYFYDRTDALQRIDFMENCVRLTKSPFYNKPMKLMLFQKAFIEAKKQSRKRHNFNVLFDDLQFTIYLRFYNLTILPRCKSIAK